MTKSGDRTPKDGLNHGHVEGGMDVNGVQKLQFHHLELMILWMGNGVLYLGSSFLDS